MDLLRSFHLESLPEQQTRTLHLMLDNPEFDKQLGFDACCACGKLLSGTCITCTQCNRVKYCSESCRSQDANVIIPDDDEVEEGGEADTALGHSGVVCALLSLCDLDEALENGDDTSRFTADQIEASKNRIQSEKESYPATLANVISEGPCYQDTLQACSSRNGTLILHVIGASGDGELWDNADDSYQSAYAEALTELSQQFKLSRIQLFFIGPDIPEPTVSDTLSIADGGTSQLQIRTVKGLYATTLLRTNDIPAADVCIFFNPGFTVPDYNWTVTLAAIPRGTPFLSTTNTELEGVADCQYLLDQDTIETVPLGLADIFGLLSPVDDQDDKEEYATAFFNSNPFSGDRVRQNGTMANDMYVKNHWILGGVLDSFDQSKTHKDKSAKKLKSTEANSKTGNPALI